MTIGIFNTLDIRVTVKVHQLLCGSQEDGAPHKLSEQLQFRNDCTCRGVTRKDKVLWRLSHQNSMHLSVISSPSTSHVSSHSPTHNLWKLSTPTVFSTPLHFPSTNELAPAQLAEYGLHEKMSVLFITYMPSIYKQIISAVQYYS